MANAFRASLTRWTGFPRDVGRFCRASPSKEGFSRGGARSGDFPHPRGVVLLLAPRSVRPEHDHRGRGSLQEAFAAHGRDAGALPAEYRHDEFRDPYAEHRGEHPRRPCCRHAGVGLLFRQAGDALHALGGSGGHGGGHSALFGNPAEESRRGVPAAVAASPRLPAHGRPLLHVAGRDFRQVHDPHPSPGGERKGRGEAARGGDHSSRGQERQGGRAVDERARHDRQCPESRRPARFRDHDAAHGRDLPQGDGFRGGRFETLQGDSVRAHSGLPREYRRRGGPGAPPRHHAGLRRGSRPRYGGRHDDGDSDRSGDGFRARCLAAISKGPSAARPCRR